MDESQQNVKQHMTVIDHLLDVRRQPKIEMIIHLMACFAAGKHAFVVPGAKQ
jgi:hypothetical protein